MHDQIVETSSPGFSADLLASFATGLAPRLTLLETFLAKSSGQWWQLMIILLHSLQQLIQDCPFQHNDIVTIVQRNSPQQVCRQFSHLGWLSCLGDPGPAQVFSNVKRAAEIVKGSSFHCILTPSVIIIVASKAFGAWLPQEFALDWEFHDKVRHLKYFWGGSSHNLDSKDSLFIITIISPDLLPCHKLLLTWTDQRTGLRILNLFKNSSAISKTHFRPFPIWSVRAKYGYKPPTSAWVWMHRNVPKY